VNLFIISALIFLTGCSSTPGFDARKDISKAESARFNKFLDETFDEFVSQSPEFLTALGKKESYDKLNDYSEAFELKMKNLSQVKLAALKDFDYAKLDEQARLSYDLYKKKLEHQIADYIWKDYQYPFNQQFGIHSELPTFMMNMHQVSSEQDLRDYISRLNEFRRVFSQVLDQVKRSEKNRIVPPKFVFPYVIEAAGNIIQGKPFDQSQKDSPLFLDFKTKLAKLKLSEEKNKELTAMAEKALVSSVQPAYLETIAFLKKQARRAKKDAGVWKFPNGNEFYRVMVERYTTTKMTPEQIHKLGLENVARLHREMNEVLKKLNYKGNLQSFFKYLRDSPEFYYPNTDEGRKAYLDDSLRYYKNIQTKIPQFFRRVPKAGFEIRAVEKFRENSAGVAFYEQPSEDGSRPGVYYVNLKDMRNLPKHEAEVVLYHEGAPGHHFQIALAQELKGLPKIRRFSHSTAFVEGWGLYTEHLAKEMGAYQSLYSEFGRLSLELLRASRLVVDTGIHAKKWSRERAINYFKKNNPGALEDQKNEIERYIVMPGQATAYMVGKLKIEELRKKAQDALGPQFDIRDYHDLVLGNGALPLDALEDLVNRYIAQHLQVGSK
jgi:uncharacterized protein (DUF885 family)